jgi:hypothetical protein
MGVSVQLKRIDRPLVCHTRSSNGEPFACTRYSKDSPTQRGLRWLVMRRCAP